MAKHPSDPVVRFKELIIELLFLDLIEGPAGLSLLDSLQSCVESFFLGLRVKCLPSIPISSIHCCYRHSQDSDRVQLHAGKDLGAGSPQRHQLGRRARALPEEMPEIALHCLSREGMRKGVKREKSCSHGKPRTLGLETGIKNKVTFIIFSSAVCIFSVLLCLGPALRSDRISSAGRHC